MRKSGKARASKRKKTREESNETYRPSNEPGYSD